MSGEQQQQGLPSRFERFLAVSAFEPWLPHYMNYALLKWMVNNFEVKLTRPCTTTATTAAEGTAILSSSSPPPSSSSSNSNALNTSTDTTPLLRRTMSKPVLMMGNFQAIMQKENQSITSAAAAAASSSASTDEIGGQQSLTTSSSGAEVVQLMEPSVPQQELDVARAEIVGVLEEEKKRVSKFLWKTLRATSQNVNGVAQEKGVSTAVANKTLYDALLNVEEMTAFHRLNGQAFEKICAKIERKTGWSESQLFLGELQEQIAPVLTQCKALGEQIKRVYEHLNGQPALQQLIELVDSERVSRRNPIVKEFKTHNAKATVNQKPLKMKSSFPAAVAVAVLLVFLVFPLFDPQYAPAQRCLAILVAGTIMWVTEVLPLFLTSLFVTFFIAVSKVLCDKDGVPLKTTDAASQVLRTMFPGNILLVLAGFSIAQAFTKYGLDIKIAMALLRRPLWATPRRFLIAVELLCFIMAPLVSNVAGSVLVITVVMPILRDLPKGCVYSKTLLLAIAMSGNVGGMTNQIASPQTAVSAALKDNHSVQFATFSLVSLPVTPILLVCGHLLVLFFFPPDVTVLPAISTPTVTQADVESGIPKERMWWYRKPAAKRIFVATIALFAVLLWTLSSWLTVLGKNIGITSFIPILLLYGFGFLNEKDFVKLPWPLVFLLSGGSVLGAAVESSQLLELASGFLLSFSSHLWLIAVASGALMMIAGSFISHTVAALILLELCWHIGDSLGHHGQLLVMTAVIMCCGAAPLPISSFPNINTFSVQNSEGVPYLKTLDFIKVGLPFTLISYLLSITLTYGISLLFGL